MMLYVFHVDVGRMMNFDMTVALSSVENLKDTIERLHGIPSTNIVLLVSGGEMLTQSTQVSYYSAGTDTNPIYMFLTGDAKLPPGIAQNEPDLDLREQVERCLELPAVYETVVTRAQLAHRMHDLARDEERLCERLVHEQHLQQQGWSAVVANMEDLTEEFRQRFRNFCVAFDGHLEKRNNYLQLLSNFGDDLTKLARIPILPGLMPLAEEDFHGFDEYLDTDEVFSQSHVQQESVLLAGIGEAAAVEKESSTQTDVAGENVASSSDDKSSTSPNKKLKMGNEPAEEEQRITRAHSSSTSSTRRYTLNLLQWITSRENHNTLKLMSDECTQGLGTFNAEVYEKLRTEVQNIIKLAEQGEVKEIKGLSERLCKLEEFKYKIKNMVQDQKELSTAFQQNQNRAMNLRDASILPDLCDSHQSQMLVMLQNHQKIRDYRRCIAKAKDELGNNLHTRLKRIVWIENAMSEFDNRLLFYHRCLKRAERHINIIEQIHQAPCIYVAAVTEVVRRKIFSSEFCKWASKLAEDFDTIHSEEVRRRQLFNTSFEGHFLNILFPGMNDMPPAFANENPLIFDARLPNITKSDIDMLSSYLPDLATDIQLPDMGPVINFFVSRSGAHQKERMEELLKQQVVAALRTDAMDGSVHEKSDKEITGKAVVCEDTEFEQLLATTQTVATSTSENREPDTMARSTTTECPLMQSAETLTEESESSMRQEVERLRKILTAMSKLSVNCLRSARANLETFRTDVQSHRQDMQSDLQLLNEQWNVMRMRYEKCEQTCTERDQELQTIRESLRVRNEELSTLLAQNSDVAELQAKCVDLEVKVAELLEQLKVAQLDKDRAVVQAREQLIHEHKSEIESLRCRFKLMTSMEHSPSETSLEKLEPNMIELAQHEVLLAQLRSKLEAEKDRVVSAAVEAERALWQSKIFPLNSESVMANVNVLKELLEERERQLEQLREKDLLLTKENIQLKTRLVALTNEDGNSWLKEKIEYLNRDKNRLEEELTMEKSKRLEMESSFAAAKSSAYEQQGALPRSKSSGSSHKYVVLESCAKGDIVFVVWSMRHGQFMVVQDSPSLYFVHAESLAGLNLQLPTPNEAAAADELSIPMPYYAIGRVTDKEYCQAKKDENRYRVIRGSKFYRIKLAPLTTKQATRRDRLESFSTSISRSISQCESQSDSSSPLTGIASSNLRQPLSIIEVPTISEDMVDQPTTTSAAVPTVYTAATSSINLLSSATVAIGFSKERTISITSVNEEDDEPVSLLSDRCRYISVSEEDEPPVATAASTQQQQQQQESVITEQPTSSSKLKLDLLLASVDIPTTEIAPTILTASNITTSTSLSNTLTNTTSLTSAPANLNQTIQTEPTAAATAAIIIPPTEVRADSCSPFIPASFGTTSEDSDEYRSLEAKDETDFPISD